MEKSLYPFAKQWDMGSGIYFYSDPHFADDEMKHLRHNYIGDEEQVKRINQKVGKKGTLVILGDIGDVEWVKKIRGYKVLVMGNHDAGATNYKRISQPEQVEWERHYDPHYYALGPNQFRGEYISTKKVVQEAQDNHLFDEVYEGPLFISEKILLSHEPISLPYIFNIHGHDHGGSHNEGAQSLNMCAELIDYTPVSLNDIIKKGYLKHIESIHRITINEAARKSKKKESK